MADKKVKIWNRSKGLHHFVFSDGIKKLPINPGGFTFVPIDEVYFVDGSSKSFRKGILEIDPSEVELRVELGYDNENPNALTMEELEKLLKGNLTKEVKERLSGITERHAFDKLVEVGRKLDLNKSKVDFIEKLTGMKVYHELLEDKDKDTK